VFAIRPDPTVALEEARRRSPTAEGWLSSPPARARRLHRSTELGDPAAFENCAAGLLDWSLHRRAGLRVCADGPARNGITVVLGLRTGFLWVLAPCRVVALIEEPDRIGFDYATLPGHPERGVERFVVRRDAGGVRLEVTARSAPAFWGSRLVPAAARAVQRLITERYLRAAQGLAGESPSPRAGN
jgi:uncharacterized protein (UPF0548 family)